MICGGIDLGGTKIEARLFKGKNLSPVATNRIPTPSSDFDAMIAGLVQQIDWLKAASDDPHLPVGICLPGIVDTGSGACYAANLPCAGQSISAAIKGHELVVLNDAVSFVTSESFDPSGPDTISLFGLILGTGMGGGFFRHTPPAPPFSMPVEIGHIGVPARTIAALDLPLFPCGCGKSGCYETYLSGTGLSNIVEHVTGKKVAADAIARLKNSDDIWHIWSAIAAECLSAIQFQFAADTVVLGGGLSNIPDIDRKIAVAAERLRFAARPMPRVTVAKFGETSGARGAAIAALANTGFL